MAKTHQKILTLEKKPGRMLKISNNTEHHGKDWIPAFTFMVEGIMLSKDELNEFMCDKYCWASWFNTRAESQIAEPMTWWGEEWFYIGPSYEGDSLTIMVSGDVELEFEGEEPNPEDEDADGRPACEIDRISLKPRLGGLTEMKFALTLRPEIGKKNLALQEHQHREIRISLEDAKAVERKRGKQTELPLGAPADGNGAAKPSPAAEASNKAGDAMMARQAAQGARAKRASKPKGRAARK